MKQISLPPPKGSAMICKINYDNRNRIIDIFHLFTIVLYLAAIAIASESVDESFFHSCAKGDFKVISDAIKKDPLVVNSKTVDGESCLHLSAISGNEKVAKLLLEAGADPNVRTTHDEGLRMHPLSWNVYAGHYDIVELLLKHNADVNADFDSMASGKNKEKVTVLDMVEAMHDLEKEPTEETVNVVADLRKLLIKYGAKKFKQMDGEL